MVDRPRSLAHPVMGAPESLAGFSANEPARPPTTPIRSRPVAGASRADQAKREDLLQLQRFVEDSPVALAMFDADLCYLHASRQWREDYALPDGDLRGVAHQDSEVIPNLPEIWQTLASGRAEVQQGEHCVERADGTVRWLRWEVRPWRVAARTLGGVIVFTEDISERKRADAAAKDAAQYARSLIEASLDPMVTISAEGRITDVNAAAEQVTGVDREQLIGSDFAGYFTEPDKARNGCQQVFLHGPVTDYPLAIRHRSGQVTEVLCNASVYRDPDGTARGVFASARDITQRMAAERRNGFLASHDRLTDLPNRELFYDRLAHAISQARRKGQRTAVMFLDLDGFKAVNDTFGHGAGDLTLKEVARRLQTCLRDTDSVARVGGDEFAVVLGEIQGLDDVSRVAEKIIDRIAEPIAPQEAQECRVGVSIGIAIYPENGAEIDRLLSAADAAMYASKTHGKNSYTFSREQVGDSDLAHPRIAMIWVDNFGVALLDEQHQTLVNLLNRLNLAINCSEPVEGGDQLLAEILSCLRIQFETEEKLMKQYGFADSATHQNEHQRLSIEEPYLRQKFSQGGDLLVMQWLKDWFLTHIAGSGKALAEYLIQNGVR